MAGALGSGLHGAETSSQQSRVFSKHFEPWEDFLPLSTGQDTDALKQTAAPPTSQGFQFYTDLLNEYYLIQRCFILLSLNPKSRVWL